MIAEGGFVHVVFALIKRIAIVGKFENIEWNPFCINKVSGDVADNDIECSAVDELTKMSE